MIKLLRLFVKILACLLSILVAGLIFVTSTNSGLHLLINFATKISTGGFVAETIEGSLLSQITIKKAVFSNENFYIKLDNFHLDWEVSDLFLGRINLKQLHVNNLQINHLINDSNDDISHKSSTNGKTIKTATLTKNTQNANDQKLSINQLPLILQHKQKSLQRFFHHVHINDLVLENISYNQNNASKFIIDTFNIQLNKNSLYDDNLNEPSKQNAHNNQNININKTQNTQNINNAQETQKNQDNQNNQNNHDINLHIKGQFHGILPNPEYNYTANLVVDGTINENLNLTWFFDIKFPSTKSNINSNGTLQGQIAQPNLECIIQANKLHVAKINSEKLWLKFYLDTSWQKNSFAQLKINDLHLFDINAKNIELNTELKTNLVKHKNFFQQNLPEYFLKTELLPVKLEFSNKKSLLINKLAFTTGLNSTGLNTQANITIDKYSPLTFELKLPQTTSWSKIFNDQPIFGTINWNVANLGILQTSLSDAIENLQGKLNVVLEIFGTTHQPQFKGKITWSNVALHIKEFAVTLTNINGNLRFDANKNLQYQTVIHSGNNDGILNINGNTVLHSASNNSSDLKHYTTNLKIRGNNFLTVNTKEYQIITNPNLNLNIENEKITLSGLIHIPNANIAPFGFSDVNSLPPELVFVDEKHTALKNQQTKPINFFAKLRLTLGDDVKISIMGLQGKLKGSVDLKEQPNKVTTAVGSLYVRDGFYLIHGQKLQVRRGVLNFFGSNIVNPELNVEAIREFKSSSTNAFSNFFSSSMTVGVRLHGMLDNTKIDLFSTPEGLTKPDILSYLIIGRPSAQASGYAGQMLLQSITSLNLGGSKDFAGFIDGLKDTFGFSEFGLTEETQLNHVPTELKTSNQSNNFDSSTAFVLGKYLTPKIFISYSMGLLNSINIFRVKYSINNNWSLQNENSSLGSGVDLLYIIEKN